MPVQTLHPDERWVPKTRAVLTTVFLALVVPLGLLGYFAGLENGGSSGALIGVGIVLGVNALWYLPGLALVRPYFRTLAYEIRDDEVIVRVGLITHSVKHVPYRTVTNLKVTRGPFDRMFGVGTLAIQTAGFSGSSGAEESLVGLADVQAVYEMVARTLRRYRSAMSPTAADEEETGAAGAQRALLREVRAIREELEARS